jgi:hypothetical protein
MMPMMTSTNMPAVLAMAASLSLRFLVHRGTKAAATQLAGQARQAGRQQQQGGRGVSIHSFKMETCKF